MVHSNTAIDNATISATAQRFWSHVVCVDSSTDTCWHWLAYKDKHGYGRFGICRCIFRAPRVAWILTHGDIDPTMTIDHLCRNHACVNPAHLEQVSRRENTLRGNGFPGQNSRKTHCPQGHLYDESNTQLTNKNLRGSVRARACRTCKYEQKRARRQRNKL